MTGPVWEPDVPPLFDRVPQRGFEMALGFGALIVATLVTVLMVTGQLGWLTQLITLPIMLVAAVGAALIVHGRSLPPTQFL